MKLLVTGSSGHLGEGLMRSHLASTHDIRGLDRLPSAFTTHVGSLTDRAFVRRALHGVDAVVHAATLHKPHVSTHARHAFLDTNVTGTLNLLEEAVSSGVSRVVFISTTSAFGQALVPPPAEPAAWITEDVRPVPKNIYGVTKVAAEDLCELFHRQHGLPCVVLRTSRFFPEEDDDPAARAAFDDANLKANELLYRRVDLQDVVDAVGLAVDRAPSIGFTRYIISATTPFAADDAAELRRDAAAVVARRVPAFVDEWARRGWRMFGTLDRVYVNARARHDLGWRPRYDFQHAVDRLRANEDPRSPLARAVGTKGYHTSAEAIASASTAVGMGPP